jgi:uncharacterized protein YjbI with pentapeptide repeats
LLHLYSLQTTKGDEMNATKLKNILSEHAKWLADNETGTRADLSDANLRDSDLRYADLSNANLSNANLRGANLSYANLRDANLSNADLCGANLSYANLSNADLSGADLSDANLRDSDLRYANLRYADLSYANLRGANLDYSCWPLSCRSNHVTVDARIAAQLAAHFCVLDCDDKEYQKARKAILKFAYSSHRAKDLGLVK